MVRVHERERSAMSAENKALIERWFEEVWNKGRSGPSTR